MGDDTGSSVQRVKHFNDINEKAKGHIVCVCFAHIPIEFGTGPLQPLRDVLSIGTFVGCIVQC